MSLIASIIGWIVLGIIGLIIMSAIGLILIGIFVESEDRIVKFFEWRPSNHIKTAEEISNSKVYFSGLIPLGKRIAICIMKQEKEKDKNAS